MSEYELKSLFNLIMFFCGKGEALCHFWVTSYFKIPFSGTQQSTIVKSKKRKLKLDLDSLTPHVPFAMCHTLLPGVVDYYYYYFWVIVCRESWNTFLGPSLWQKLKCKALTVFLCNLIHLQLAKT